MATGNDSGNDNRVSTKYGNSKYSHDVQHGSSVGNQSPYGDAYGHQRNHNQNSTINSSRDFNHNRFNYQGENQNLGPNSPRQIRYNNDSPSRSNYEGLGRYPHSYMRTAHQSPYDTDASRGESKLDDGRFDQEMTQRNAPQADNLRIESKGYGATLHRYSAGTPHNPSHAMNGSSSGPGNTLPKYQSNQVNQSSSFTHSPDPRPIRSSYEDGNRVYGSSPPRSISRYVVYVKT